MSQEIEVKPLITQMAQDLKALLQHRGIEKAYMIGIHTGGVWVAEQLHQALAIEAPLGTLNIAFYRDDFTRIGVHPQVKPSVLPFSVEDAPIILVDDVLYTGRTIRAALNEIFDYGRPASVILACLVDCSGRELPVQADVLGKVVELSEHEQVKLTGPTPLRLLVTDAGT